MAGLFTGVLAEEHLEGKPWVNPELPGNLPKERPAPEDNYYLKVNYDLHSQPARPPMEGQESDSIGYRLEKEMTDEIWSMVDAGENTETKILKIITSPIMDTERREKDGLEPVMEYVRQVKAVKNLDELSALCRREGFLFGMPYATFQLERSTVDPTKFAIQIIDTDVVPRLQFDAEAPQPTEEEDWLDKEDHVKFNEKAERMSESLSRIELADGLMLDGSRTFFEQAADLMGLRLVLDMAEKTEGFDYDLFFRTLAGKFYRSFQTREAALSNYSSDFHPAHFVRANFCLEQVDEFYRTYPAVHEGSGTYRAPEDRICLW